MSGLHGAEAGGPSVSRYSSQARQFRNSAIRGITLGKSLAMCARFCGVFCAVVVVAVFCVRGAICENNEGNAALKNYPENITLVSTETTTFSTNELNENIQKSTVKPRKRKARRKLKRKYLKKSSLGSSDDSVEVLLNEVDVSKNVSKLSIQPNKKKTKATKKRIRVTTVSPSRSSLTFSNIDSTAKPLKKRRKIAKKRKRILHKTPQPIATTEKLQINISLKKIDYNRNEITIPQSKRKISLIKHHRSKDRCKVPIRGGCEQICFPKGKLKCSCYTGFYLGKDGRSCFDIDECKVDNGGCQKTCKNTVGSYRCECGPGMRLSQDKSTCEDINECLLRNGHGPCQDTCINRIGGYECTCKGLAGTKLAKDKHGCLEDEECPADHGCSHICVIKRGIEFCNCPDGMELTPDWKTCRDINECEDDFIRSTCPYDCVNTIGSYHCQSPFDVQNEQGTPPIACKPLYPPATGFFSCSRKAATPIYSRNGRKRIINSPGTVCRLVCPKVHKIVGHTFLVCGSSGKWEGKNTGKCVEVDPPKIECPNDVQRYESNEDSSEISVQLTQPITNIDWKFVSSNPVWAKSLNGILKKGFHEIEFTAKDPTSGLSSSCALRVEVK